MQTQQTHAPGSDAVAGGICRWKEGTIAHLLYTLSFVVCGLVKSLYKMVNALLIGLAPFQSLEQHYSTETKVATSFTKTSFQRTNGNAK